LNELISKTKKNIGERRKIEERKGTYATGGRQGVC